MISWCIWDLGKYQLVFSLHNLDIYQEYFFHKSAILGTSCPLKVEWIWSVLFFFWPVVFLYLHLARFRNFPRFFSLFPANLAFRVHSMLSGFGVPYFFLARRFSVPPLSKIQKFSKIFFPFHKSLALCAYKSMIYLLLNMFLGG